MHKSLQPTVWVWSFSSITLFPLCMIYPTMLLFPQLHPCSHTDYNFICILKAKICGYKHSAKHLKNPKASSCTFFPLHMIPDFLPGKAHVLLYSLPSELLCVWGLDFSPLSYDCRICQISKPFFSCTPSSRPCITAVGPEAKQQKKLCPFLNQRDLSPESDEDPPFQEQSKEKQSFRS